MWKKTSPKTYSSRLVPQSPNSIGPAWYQCSTRGRSPCTSIQRLPALAATARGSATRGKAEANGAGRLLWLKSSNAYEVS